MKLAVIDTNVIIAAHITKHDDSATRKIIRAVSDGTVVPIVTPAILSEYAEVMSRTKFKIEPETVAATIRYFRDDTLKSEGDLEGRYNLPVVGVIPNMNENKGFDYYQNYYYASPKEKDKNNTEGGKA